ncbi:alpha/beta fold hydrolase [Limosilactobacillus fermentum]|uniref:alpha/beta fold hydrolase n=1 Tax=Limosilactobacillus fermentum TaxID=1613 RepID=UPI0021CB22A8|nr:hypothetical protein [Limosilactobacillus fermentum]
MITIIQYKTVNVDGLDVFYREAGDPSKPAFVLLHGFPSSSSMFRNLMRCWPVISTCWRRI